MEFVKNGVIFTSPCLGRCGLRRHPIIALEAALPCQPEWCRYDSPAGDGGPPGGGLLVLWLWLRLRAQATVTRTGPEAALESRLPECGPAGELANGTPYGRNRASLSLSDDSIARRLGCRSRHESSSLSASSCPAGPGTNLRYQNRWWAAEWRSGAMAEPMRYETFIISARGSIHKYTPQGVNCRTFYQLTSRPGAGSGGARKYLFFHFQVEQRPKAGVSRKNGVLSGRLFGRQTGSRRPAPGWPLWPWPRLALAGAKEPIICFSV